MMFDVIGTNMINIVVKNKIGITSNQTLSQSAKSQ